MRRREFIGLLGSAAAWPLTASTQESMPTIGWLDPTSQAARASFVEQFHAGLAERGYFVGRNVAIEYRWAEGDNSRLPALAADLVNRQVAVIAATDGIPSARAQRKAPRLPFRSSFRRPPIRFSSGWCRA
jgi:putative tryptophan/tyrosine transport system substrate-binding protein